MLTICSAVCCMSEAKDKTVGTSTNCSAICGKRRSRSTKRGRMMSFEIFGTSMTCSTGNCVSRDLKNCTSCSPAATQEHRESAQRSRWRPPAPQCAAATAPAAESPRLALAATRRQAHLRRPRKSTQCVPPALLRCGACTRTGP